MDGQRKFRQYDDHSKEIKTKKTSLNYHNSWNRNFCYPPVNSIRNQPIIWINNLFGCLWSINYTKNFKYLIISFPRFLVVIFICSITIIIVTAIGWLIGILIILFTRNVSFGLSRSAHPWTFLLYRLCPLVISLFVIEARLCFV